MVGSRPARNVAVAGAFRVVAAVCALLSNVLLARSLPPDQLGAAFLAISLVALLSPLANGGTGRTIVRLLVHERAESGTRHALASAIALTVVMTTIVVATVLLFGEKIVPNGTHWLLSAPTWQLVAITIGFAAFATLFGEALRGMHRAAYAGWVGGACYGVVFVSMLTASVILFPSVELVNVVFCMLCAHGLAVASGLVAVSRDESEARWALRMAEVVKVFKVSFPLMVTGIVLTTLVELHTWVLAKRGTLSDVGNFGLATRTVIFFVAPATVVASGISPNVAEQWARREPEKVQELLRKWATLISFPVLPSLFFCAVLSTQIATSLYGRQEPQIPLAIIILCLAYFVSTATGLPGMFLVMSGNERKVLQAAMVAGAAGLATTYFLAGTLGSVGAAVGVGVSVIVHNCAMWSAARNLGVRTELSSGQAASAVRRARRLIEFFALRNKAAFWLERALRPLESAFWRMRGLHIVECFGDSHAAIFRRLNDSGEFPRHRFRTVSVQGATAHSLLSTKSKSNSLKHFRRFIGNPHPTETLMTLVGEVDVGYLAWKKSGPDLASARQFAEASVGTYMQFLESSGWPSQSILVVTIPLPVVDDSNLPASATRSDLHATLEDRFLLGLAFNDCLKSEATKRGYRVLDLDGFCLDDGTGRVRQALWNVDRSDHHYAPGEYVVVITKALREMGW